MTTVDQVIESTIRRIEGVTARPRLNKLNGALTAATDQVTLEFALDRGLAAGSLISVDYELMYVWSVNSLTLTVQRGVHGTTAVAHDDDSLVQVDPRFPKFQVLEAMRNEIDAWPTGLMSVRTDQIAVPAHRHSVQIPGATGRTVYRLLDLRYLNDVGDVITPGWHPARLSRHLSVNQTYLNLPNAFDRATTIEVTYGFAPTTGITDPTATFASLDWDERWAEILELGAAWRLLIDKGARRADTQRQGQNRFAPETTVDDALRAAELWRTRAEQRVGIEERHIRDLYGVIG